MKKIYLILIFLVYQVSQAQSQSFEKAANGDTINLIDVLGKKQGKWIVRGKHKPGSCFAPEQKVEEGKYTDNRKIGKWLEYY